MQSSTSLFFPPFQLDLTNEQLWREKRAVVLRAKTFAVLRYLVTHAGELVTKEDLLNAVWPNNSVSEGAVKICVQELRKALQDDSRRSQFIETVHRRGYRFIAPLTTSPTPVPSFKFQVSSSQPVSNPQSPAPTLVGREAELQQLQRWLEKALQSERQVVFVTGEPGIGKTMLLETFLQSLESRVPRLASEQGQGPRSKVQFLPQSPTPSLWIARGQCVETYGAGEAYMPVLEALDRLCQGEEREALIVQLRQYAPMWLVQLISVLHATERAELQHHLVGTAPERMLREFGRFIAALTAERGLVLVLEDLHWSDYSTLTLLSYLAQQPEPAKLLVLCAYRPVEILTGGHPLSAMHQELVGRGRSIEFSLAGLTEQAIEEYLDYRFPHSVVPTRLAQVLYERTEGNPLFLVSMVDDLVTNGVMAPGHAEELPPLPTLPPLGGVPERLRQLITRQMERLSAADRKILEAGSVTGLEFSVAEVAAAVEADLGEVEERCEECVRRQQFLRPAGLSEWTDGTVATRYGFQHALYQELWQERVKAGRRQRWQQRIGERKEGGYGKRAGRSRPS